MLSTRVCEVTQVAEARRRAQAVADASGFDEEAAGRVALVATELATNMVKHATDGELLTGDFEDATGAGVELIAVDKGPGMADLGRSLRDGYSTAGSSGTGLGAVWRLSDAVDAVSQAGVGTAILARLRARRGTLTPPGSGAPWGAVTVAMPGEEACGDGYCVRAHEGGRTLLMVDGLGHGREAAKAAMEAVRLFRAHEVEQPAAIVEALHAGLRPTRGAAVAVARQEFGAERVLFCGIGNIGATVVAGDGHRRMVSHDGTAGLNARKVNTYEYPMPPSSLVVLHSDGLTSGWSLDRYAGLSSAHPSLVAAVLYRDFGRRRDDAAVLVSRSDP